MYFAEQIALAKPKIFLPSKQIAEQPKKYGMDFSLDKDIRVLYKYQFWLLRKTFFLA
jgi:hypothetical protein